MRSVFDSPLASYAALGGVFAVDRISKRLLLTHPNYLNAPLPGMIEFTDHRNFGLVANLPLPFWIIISLSILILSLLLFAFYRTLKKPGSFRPLALSLIIGGAFGNLYDRLAYGYVFDWVLLFKTSVINLADVFILSGIVCYLLAIRSGKQNPGLDEALEKR